MHMFRNRIKDASLVPIGDQMTHKSLSIVLDALFTLFWTMLC